jgi:glycosyltransferase involved in cell wall biosynthesis
MSAVTGADGGGSMANGAIAAPIVSIGLPVYNGEKYLELCIRNTLAQTFRDFELIISDNASRDRTQEICERIAREDARVRYFRAGENQGATWNYNRVLELARGRYFKWVAYDDLMSPDYLEVCVRSLEEDKGDILAYGLTTIIDADGKEEESLPDRIHIAHERPSDRLKEYLYKVGLTNAIYGVMRVDVLRSTPAHEAYPGSDMVLLGELAIRGRFREHAGIRFYRRIHPQASAPSNKSLSDLAAWFNPKHAGRLVLPAWEHFRGYLSAIRRSPWSPLEKTRCLVVLLRWKKHGAPELFREALVAIRFKLAPPRRAAPARSAGSVPNSA